MSIGYAVLTWSAPHSYFLVWLKKWQPGLHAPHFHCSRLFFGGDAFRRSLVGIETQKGSQCYPATNGACICLILVPRLRMKCRSQSLARSLIWKLWRTKLTESMNQSSFPQPALHCTAQYWLTHYNRVWECDVKCIAWTQKLTKLGNDGDESGKSDLRRNA